MITTQKEVLTAETTILAPIEKVWDMWTDPKHIVRWNNASDDWHTPHAENDVRPGGKFLWRMEARDGSMGFDFNGEYNKVEPQKFLEYTLGDGRKVQVSFFPDGDKTMVTENFEPEDINSLELQKEGWQSIMTNFRNYVENSGKMELMHFEIDIRASVEHVYKTMIDEKKYNEWTTPFNPSSHFEGSWEQGSEIRFIGTDQDGSIGGMVSRIRENIPNKFISIEHLGIIQNGKEITTGPEVEGWAGARENYLYREENGITHLMIELDANNEFKAFMEDTWPVALNKLKEICESGGSDIPRG
jgi:uncharacterized protein YndB with AHSA1/START domain